MTTMENNSGEQTPPKERKMTLTQKESTIIIRLSNEGADMGFVAAFTGLEKTHDNEEMMIKFIKELLEKKKLITAINFIIREEIRGNGLSLLREESLGSSLLKCLWFQFVGKNYMNQVIKPFVKEVYKIAKKPLEINPAFTNGDTQKAKKNLEKLLGLVKNFLSTFFYSTDHVPADFEEVLFTLYMLLTETEGARKSHLGLGYSEDALRLFGGFFLLRFICPAIVSPQKYGLMKEQDFNPNVQKTLVQVSKILQSIANQIEFDPKKDPHMIPANDVIQWCMPQMLAFLNKLMTKIDRSESY